MRKDISHRENFLKGIIKDNPVLVLLLGLCPTLGVTSSAINGLGMGLATAFVLLMSNGVISLIKNLIADKVRIPSFIVIIASFVTVVQLLMAAYAPTLNDQLGLFIPLIVVNCIVLGRAEAFASRNSFLSSLVDSLGMGLGFTLALLILGSLREVLGNLTIFGFPIVHADGMLIFILAPGAFITLGLMVVVMNWFKNRRSSINKN